MRDHPDMSIRSFVTELLADPPLPPPFPHAVVVKADEPTERKLMSQQQEDWQEAPKRTMNSAFRYAAAAFVVALLVVGGAFAALRSNSDESDVSGPNGPSTVEDGTTPAQPLDPNEGASVLIGMEAKVVGGQGTVPDVIEFKDDGTYRVIDTFLPIHTGSYEVDGDVVTFDVRPEEDDVLWVRNDVHLRMVHSCQEMPGRYTVVFEAGSTIKLDVINDPCVTRIMVANGIQLEIDGR